ncbi:protein kinase-like (PK-like) protein [Colletotrichum truncatum]|uniref:Protein kinase-like (PK-like) protein n=1 Tax=Colletotrichum truncatum TaxID=5467 RepID=A0ACC3YH80_COLTU|nr:protein kinase-like (PK-like) protein [Colletotrichum truncatum]KAF6792805.1 protein kinase-like (PK-like) protein [Colletotrichum truncatum]
MSLKSLKDSFDLNGIGSAFKAAGQQTNSELTVIDMMAQDIHKSRVYYSGNMDAPYWLPVNDLYRIVNEESVYKALTHTLNPDQVDATDVRGYAARVCGLIEYVDHRDQLSSSGARSMFAILVMIDKVDEIKQYIDNGFTDEDLPLVSPPNNTGHRLCPKSFATGELECWTIGQTWKRWEWTAFQTYQRMTRSPFFELRQSNNKLPHYDLDVGTVLPFVGDFGKLETLTIHQDSSQGQPFFAVKELHRYREVQYGKRELDFKEEVRSWAKSAGVSKHPHLIRLLATWRQNDTWCLLFPWANSNLEGFWRSKTPGRNLRFTKWVSKQCLGLAEGLRSIHKSRSDPMRQWGIHGDIKPQNILWFNDPEDKGGKLVISDFGLTRFHGEETRSNALPPGKDPTYQAPEYGFHNGISRAADIWALGCVYLEFVTWYLIGFEGLENSIQRRIQDDRGQIESFRQDKFFNLSPTENGGHGAELKRSVTNVSLFQA